MKCRDCGKEFDAPQHTRYPRKYCDKCSKQRKKEWEKVHLITQNILKPMADRVLGLVLDCFSERYHVGDIFSVPQRIMN